MEEDIFKTLGHIFDPTPVEELNKITEEAGLKTQTFEEMTHDNSPTLYDVWYEKCNKAIELGYDKFVFEHEGNYYFVKWKKKTVGLWFWGDPELIYLI